MNRRDIGTDDPRVKVRPGKGTRPRTKKHPNFADTTPGIVTVVNRGRFTVVIPDQQRAVRAVKARALGRKGIVVGDKVSLEDDTSGTADTLARVVTLGPRHTALCRIFDESETGIKEKLIVANTIQMLIVVATANLEPEPGMIDRVIVSALDVGVKSLLTITKVDLDAASNLTNRYKTLLLIWKLRRGNYDTGEFQDLHERLRGETTVLLGHSGVGKSTLISTLVPATQRAAGEVNQVTGKGRHILSSAIALAVPDGWVIDTPGARPLGLAYVDEAGLAKGSSELDTIAQLYPRDCTHREGSPDCELDKHSEHIEGLVSLRRLLAEIPKPYQI